MATESLACQTEQVITSVDQNNAYHMRSFQAFN